MLKAAPHDTSVNNLSGTVIYLTLAHIDNAFAQVLRGFFQLFNFTGQLGFGLSQSGQFLLSLAIHAIYLG